MTSARGAICTPHWHPMFWPNERCAIASAVESLRLRLQAEDIAFDVWPGSELSLDADLADGLAAGRLNTLNGGAWVLLGLPALEATGLLQVAEGVYGPMRNGFCGLRVTLLMGVFLALLRERRAEGATQLPPTDLHKATRALFESGLKNLNPFPALQCRTHQSMKSHDNPHPPLNVGTTLLENRCLSPGHC